MGDILDQDPGEEGGAPFDLQTAALCVEWMLSQMQGQDQAAFLAYLRNLSNSAAADRAMRGGRRMGQDAALSMRNERAFLKRFPEAKGIRLHGSWRD
jgi:hypothetical protein